ncbi:YsnF/AvaK domain-containing protein [Rufibacter tibetensis]|uniref:YsnF/AvaK domain-containing protein n=1 Tax=Rufibacter tibetensis TaxID=512763 RepID=UPI0009F8E23B|nr:YsnF/AvaK domain-containing protein [Rufibacter tibetensis]
MAQTVIGIFDSSSEAQQAVQELKNIGLSDSNIDVSSASSSSSSSSSSFGGGSSTSDSTYSSSFSSSNDNGGIMGFFRSLFSDDDDSATTYSNVASHSDCIVTVHAQTDEEARRAAIILDQYGSVDVDQRAIEYGYRSNSATGSSFMQNTASSYDSSTGTTGRTASILGTSTGLGTESYNSGSDSLRLGSTGTDSDPDTFSGGADSTYAGSTNNTVLSDSASDFNNTTSDTTRNDLTDSTSVPIIEENMQVGKREVETGGARLRSRIVERPVEEHLRLRSEHVRVERQPVNRPATEADFTGFREGEIELTEHAEVPVVNKEAHVVEEVSLGKEVEERDEVIRDTVRSTEVDVDNLTDTTRTDLDNDRSGLDLDRDRTNRDHRGLTDLDNDRNTAI